jgi:hypothetical protein
MDVFPLPAPKPSAQAPIPRALLQHAGGDAPMRLGDVSARLSDALDAAGYRALAAPDSGRLRHAHPHRADQFGTAVPSRKVGSASR